MYNQGLFSNWVPKPIQLFMLFLITLIAMPVSGVYAGSLSFMVGDTGALSEYYMWANYATTVGMGAAMPIVLRAKMRFKVRDKVVALLVLIGFLSFINATTSNPMVIVFASLILGFFKTFITIEVFLPLMAMMGGRGIFYGVFYTFILITTQVANYYAVEFSIIYNWRQFLIFVAILCFIVAMICWVVMHNKYFALKVPLHYIDWLSILLFISTFMFSAYVFSFGKQQDWLNSQNIINASIAAFASFALMVIRQATLKRPYLSFKIFTRNNVQVGLFLLLCLGMFLATTSLQNIFSVGVLGYDQLTNAKLNIMMIPGMLLAGVLAVYWFKKEKKLKFFIFAGFSSMVAYCIIMYFSMVLEFSYENWYMPMFLKGFGMCSLYISVWYYALDKLDINDMLPAIGLFLLWRSFVTVGLFSAIFSWTQYQFQIESLGNLAVYMDGMTLNAQPNFSLKTIQLNAMIVANKKLFGYIVLAGFGILIFVIAHHFGYPKFTLDKLVRLFGGKSVVARKRLKERKKLAESLKDGAGSAV
ncbi:MFS transporter [Chryseobacterium sp. 2R14A]|uniref:MFS transporter n=1 Tax=Chryseobacterium sp. 2R14A TaxID=3380353 RepID=UPI003CEB9E69